MNVTSNPLDPTVVDDLLYNLNGAVKDRTKYRNAGTSRSETIEEFSYDAFNLAEIYRSRRDVVAAGPETECEPDASTAPVNEWRYRFNPLKEREQKRHRSTTWGRPARDTGCKCDAPQNRPCKCPASVPCKRPAAQQRHAAQPRISILAGNKTPKAT